MVCFWHKIQVPDCLDLIGGKPGVELTENRVKYGDGEDVLVVFTCCLGWGIGLVALLAASPGYGWLSSNLSAYLLYISKPISVVIINIVPYTL